jgi:hypothetical protein
MSSISSATPYDPPRDTSSCSAPASAVLIIRRDRIKLQPEARQKPLGTKRKTRWLRLRRFGLAPIGNNASNASLLPSGRGRFAIPPCRGTNPNEEEGRRSWGAPQRAASRLLATRCGDGAGADVPTCEAHPLTRRAARVKKRAPQRGALLALAVSSFCAGSPAVARRRAAYCLRPSAPGQPQT